MTIFLIGQYFLDVNFHVLNILVDISKKNTSKPFKKHSHTHTHTHTVDLYIDTHQSSDDLEREPFGPRGTVTNHTSATF